MNDIVLAVVVAIASSSAIAAIIGWVRERKIDSAKTIDISVGASAKAVQSLMGAVARLESEVNRLEADLNSTRAELREASLANEHLAKQIGLLTEAANAVCRECGHTHLVINEAIGI